MSCEGLASPGPVRTSILTRPILDGPLQQCEKTRFSEVSPLPTRPAPGITVFGEGVEAPDLATVKEFFRYYISLSHGKIVDKLTVDSINIILVSELEQWRLVASKAETLNRELGVSLEATQLAANALQRENERIKETCLPEYPGCQFLPRESCAVKCGYQRSFQ